MKNRPGTLPGQETVLNNITVTANTYKTFLEGGTNIIKKDLTNLGNRHTLVRGMQGNIYEMTNSMTKNEIKRFLKQTKLDLKAVLSPRSGYTQGREIYSRIELGSGNFGKTRIARNIVSDDYVAVKKIHPKIVISADH